MTKKKTKPISNQQLPAVIVHEAEPVNEKLPAKLSNVPAVVSSGPRKARLTFLIGTNGTGKTEAMKKFLPANARNLVFPANNLDRAWHGYPLINPERRVIEDPYSLPGKIKNKTVYRLPNLNTLKGTHVVNTVDLDEDQIIEMFAVTTHPINGFRKGGLYIDDYKGMLKSHGVLPSHFKRLMNNMRHMELDVFMATHGMNEVNFQFYMHNPTFYIFRSDSPPGKKVQMQYNRYAELMEVFNRVQREAKNNQYYVEKFPK
jgi:hypothetical protein